MGGASQREWLTPGWWRESPQWFSLLRDWFIAERAAGGEAWLEGRGLEGFISLAPPLSSLFPVCHAVCQAPLSCLPDMEPGD